MTSIRQRERKYFRQLISDQMIKEYIVITPHAYIQPQLAVKSRVIPLYIISHKSVYRLPQNHP